ncbi:MAG: hypothetical protein Ct9H300mP8_06940 [Gammaproteobacteria bacterium]|nr:MAG: hypothetical protein Ct9H300mP8_06940 [Gammaproteobacteria bacterium]
MKESKKYLPRSLIVAISAVVVVIGITLAANSATTASLMASPTPIQSHAPEDVDYWGMVFVFFVVGVYWFRCHSAGFEVIAYPPDVTDQRHLRDRCGRCDIGGGSRLPDRNSGAWIDRAFAFPLPTSSADS